MVFLGTCCEHLEIVGMFPLYNFDVYCGDQTSSVAKKDPLDLAPESHGDTGRHGP